MNNINIIGRLVKEVEIKNKGDKIYTKGSLAINGKTDVFFIDFMIYGEKAEAFKKYVEKGHSVALNGSLHIAKFEGKNYTTIYVNSYTFLNNKDNKKEGEKDDNPIIA